IMIEHWAPARGLYSSQAPFQKACLHSKRTHGILTRFCQPQDVVRRFDKHVCGRRQSCILKKPSTSRQEEDSIFAGCPHRPRMINNDARGSFSWIVPVHLYLLPMIAIESRQSPHKRCPDYSVIVLSNASRLAGRKTVMFGEVCDFAVLEKAGAALVITDPQAIIRRGEEHAKHRIV